MMKLIEVTFEREGWHSYPDAPDKVEFLRNSHRHLFKIGVQLVVKSDNRDKEFFLEKDRLEGYALRWIDWSNAGSCESIATKIAKYSEDVYRVKVSEDGENSAIFYPKKV